MVMVKVVLMTSILLSTREHIVDDSKLKYSNSLNSAHQVYNFLLGTFY